MPLFVAERPGVPTPPPDPPPDPGPGAPTPTVEYSGDGSGLNAFLNDNDGEIVGLEEGGDYNLGTDGQIELEGASVSVVMRDSVIRRSNRGTTPIVLLQAGCHDFGWWNGTIRGVKPEDGLWSLTYEHEHGFSLTNVRDAEFSGIAIERVGGDGLYTGGSSYVNQWTSDVRFHHGSFYEIGRMGWAITDGVENMVVDFCTFEEIQYHLVDFEPNGYFLDGRAAGCLNCRFSDNAIGANPYGDHVANPTQAAGYALVSTGSSISGPYSGNQPFDHFEFSRNVFTGHPIKVGAFNNTGPNGGRIAAQDLRILDNESDTGFVDDADFDDVFDINGVAGVRITGNDQPLTSGGLLDLSGCSGTIVTSPNP